MDKKASYRRRDVLKALGIIPGVWMAGGKHPTTAPALVFSCSPANDVFKILAAGGNNFARYDWPEQAVAHAAHGSGVLILADGYPEKTTPLNAEIFELAAKRKLRVYVEFPSFLPDLTVGEP